MPFPNSFKNIHETDGLQKQLLKYSKHQITTKNALKNLSLTANLTTILALKIANFKYNIEMAILIQ